MSRLIDWLMHRRYLRSPQLLWVGNLIGLETAWAWSLVGWHLTWTGKFCWPYFGKSLQIRLEKINSILSHWVDWEAHRFSTRMLQGLSYSKIMSKTSILCIVLGVGIVGTGIESARLQTILHSFFSDMHDLAAEFSVSRFGNGNRTTEHSDEHGAWYRRMVHVYRPGIAMYHRSRRIYNIHILYDLIFFYGNRPTGNLPVARRPSPSLHKYSMAGSHIVWLFTCLPVCVFCTFSI